MAAEWKGGNYQKYLLDVMALYRQRPDLKAYLEVLLSIVTIGMFILFAIKPTLITIADLWTKIQSEQITSDQLDVKIKNLGLAQTIFNKEKTNIDLLNQAIPTGPDVASYVRQLEGVIKKDSITTTTISVDKASLLAPASASASMGVSFSVSGTYQNLSNLLFDLENLRRPSIIKKLDYNVVQIGQTSKTLNLSVTSDVPYN